MSKHDRGKIGRKVFLKKMRLLNPYLVNKPNEVLQQKFLLLDEYISKERIEYEF